MNKKSFYGWYRCTKYYNVFPILYKEKFISHPYKNLAKINNNVKLLKIFVKIPIVKNRFPCSLFHWIHFRFEIKDIIFGVAICGVLRKCKIEKSNLAFRVREEICIAYALESKFSQKNVRFLLIVIFIFIFPFVGTLKDYRI